MIGWLVTVLQNKSSRQEQRPVVEKDVGLPQLVEGKSHRGDAAILRFIPLQLVVVPRLYFHVDVDNDILSIVHLGIRSSRTTSTELRAV